MKFGSKLTVVAAVLIAGTAVANEKITNPVVKERVALMQTVRVNTATLGDMAQGKTAFDAAAATTARANLAAAAAEVVARFEAEEMDPFSRAKPEIWMAFDDYTTKAEALLKAAEALDTASLAGIQAGMGAVGGSCQSCHEAYRGPEK